MGIISGRTLSDIFTKAKRSEVMSRIWEHELTRKNETRLVQRIKRVL